MENEEVNNDIEAKQDYLQKKIVDKKYDTGAFVKFCLSKKKDGDDLNKWTLEELKIVVNEFLIEKYPVKILPSDEEMNKKENLKEKIIQCKKLEKSQLSGKKIVITVSNYEDNEDEKEILYEVKTAPLGWTVHRTSEDFVLLKNLIENYFPSYYVPPIKSYNELAQKTCDGYFEKKLKFINNFMNNLVESENFKASEILITFLSYENREKFLAQFEEYDARKPSDNVAEFKTLDGKVSVLEDVLSQENEGYFELTKGFINSQCNFFDLAKAFFNRVNNSMKEIIKNLESASKIFKEIIDNSRRSLMEKTLIKSYEELSCFCQNYKNVLAKQNDLFKKYMTDNFEYTCLEGDECIKIIDRREDTKVLYGLKFMKKSNEMGNYKDLSGYANKVVLSELKKKIKDNCVKRVENIKKFDQEFYPSINDLVNAWSQLETFVRSVEAKNK